MKKVGITTIRALSVGGAFGDLRDDWDCLTDKERLWLDILPWLIVIPAVILLVATFLLGGTAVQVSARTEHLIYTPLYSDPPVWILKDAEFESVHLDDLDFFGTDENRATFNSTPYSSSDGNSNSVLTNGFLQLSCGDRVTVSRVGTGRIKVAVNSLNGVTITDEVGNVLPFAKDLSKSFFFYPHSKVSSKGSNKSLESEPISYIWAMEGQIIPSRPASIDTLTTQGLMLSGRVDLLNRRVIGGGNYLVGSHDLELGDHLILATAKDTEEKRDLVLQSQIAANDEISYNSKTSKSDQSKYCDSLKPSDETFKSLFVTSSATDKGFLHIDDEKGMAVSLISNAKSVEIARYRSTAVTLEPSALKRLQKDTLFTISWSVLLFAFFLAQKLKRAYIMSRGRQENLHYSDAESSTINVTEPDHKTDISAADNTGHKTNETDMNSNSAAPSSPATNNDASND